MFDTKILDDEYAPLGMFRNGHINTLASFVVRDYWYRSGVSFEFQREALEHTLGFKLYLDWVRCGDLALGRLPVFNEPVCKFSRQ